MASSCAAVIGLGNPGDKYRRTRHNAGFWVVDRLGEDTAWREQAKLHGEYQQVAVAGGRLHLLKPLTFMNLSGRSVRALMDYFKLTPEEILVVHDELDLPVGAARLKRGGGAGGHNGLRDTIRCIGPDFARLRIGIGHPGDRERVLPYVLSQPGRDESEKLDQAIERAAQAVARLRDDGWDRAVQQLHSGEN